MSDTGIKSVIYGTYDHPGLIDYALLAQNIEEYMTKGSFLLPTYSFAESRRTGFKQIDTPADIVIVE
jgi:uridine kinase